MYKLGKIPFGQISPQCVILIEHNLVIPFDPANRVVFVLAEVRTGGVG